MAVAVAVSRGGKERRPTSGPSLHLISNSFPTRKEERRIQSMVNYEQNIQYIYIPNSRFKCKKHFTFSFSFPSSPWLCAGKGEAARDNYSFLPNPQTSFSQPLSVSRKVRKQLTVNRML